MSYQPFTELPENSVRQMARRKPPATSTCSSQLGFPSPTLQLQRTLGNQRVGELIQAKRLTPERGIIGLQPKLTVSATDDQYEQETYWPIRKVMSMRDPVVQSIQQAPQVEGRAGSTGRQLTFGINEPIIRRQQTHTRRAAHPATPTLGSCRPVQDDLRPTAPWTELQSGYRARCASAVSDVASQAERALSDIWQGRLPRAPHLPDTRSSVDCACANLPPREAAIAAMPVVLAAGPLAARLFWHFLDASGTTATIDVADMIARSAGVRAKIRRSIGRSGTSGTIRLEQSDYHDRELQFAYGAIDCVQWQVVPPARRSWRTDPSTQIRVSMLDYYEFHPARPGVSQCAHAACVESVARGEAKNFWTSGAAVVSWHDLQLP